ncbi:MAG: TIR domain-containing protein [Acidobacteriota bacterium]
MTPLIFISARSTDYQYAEEIYRFLKSHGLRMFFSQESLPELASSDYRKQIDDALDSAQHMIVVTSSKANVTSSWVEAEWGLFINEKRSGRKVGNLITVVAGGLGPSDLPASLRYYEVIPFQRDAFQKILRYVAPGLNEPISTVPPGQTAEEESRPPNAGPSAVNAGSANPAANNQRVTQASGDSGVTAVTPIVANAESTARDSVTSPGPSPVHGQSAEAKPSSEPHKRRTEPPAPSSPIESTSAGKAATTDAVTTGQPAHANLPNGKLPVTPQTPNATTEGQKQPSPVAGGGSLDQFGEKARTVLGALPAATGAAVFAGFLGYVAAAQLVGAVINWAKDLPRSEYLILVADLRIYCGVGLMVIAFIATLMQKAGKK